MINWIFHQIYVLSQNLDKKMHFDNIIRNIKTLINMLIKIEKHINMLDCQKHLISKNMQNKTSVVPWNGFVCHLT